MPLGLRAVKVADGVAVRHDGRALRDPELVRAGSDVDAVHPSPERENQKQGDGRDDCGMKGGKVVRWGGGGRTTSVVQRTISRERAMEGAVSTRVTFSPHDIFNPPRAATARPRI